MTWRVALLGAGIGQKHLDGFAALPGHFQIATICDLNLDLAQELARTCGASVTDDLDAVLADPDIDIVDICLPPAMHTPVAIRALQAGKHVVVEKPIAGSVTEADQLRAAQDASDHRVFPVFQYRFGRAFDQMRALQDAGLLGRPLVATLETHWNRDAVYYANPWRGTWERELGGAVLSHAIHAHDLLTQWFGPIDQVSAMLTTRANPVETEDCAALSFRLTNGALATSSITLGAADDTSRLRFVFSEMTVESARNPYAPGEDAWTFTARDPARQAEVDGAIAHVQPGHQGFAGLFAELANALDGQPNRAVTLHDGIAAIELVSAIYHSDRSGHAVSLPLDRTMPIAQGLRP